MLTSEYKVQEIVKILKEEVDDQPSFFQLNFFAAPPFHHAKSHQIQNLPSCRRIDCSPHIRSRVKSLVSPFFKSLKPLMVMMACDVGSPVMYPADSRPYRNSLSKSTSSSVSGVALSSSPIA